MTRYPGLLICLALVAVSANVLARSADDAFAAGLAAARAGFFQEAADHFDAAQRAGLSTPALTFNMGVVNYRLNRLDDAAAAFRALTADPDWGALAHYHLGLTEQRRGNSTAARGHFRDAQALTDSPKLKALADHRLRALLAAPAPQPSPGLRRWFGIGSVAAGYDDNVLLADEQFIGAVSDEADAFGEVLAAARRAVGAPGSGLAVDISAYYRFHGDLDDFNFGALSAGLSWRRPMGDWVFSTGLTGTAQFAGGDSYANVVSHRLQLDRAFDTLSWRLRNELSYHDGASDFDFITGWRNRTRLELGNRIDRLQLKLGYEFEINNRDDLESGETFSSYSPRAHRVYAGGGYDVGQRLGLELEGALRLSDYRDANRFLDGDGNLLEVARDQDVLSLRLRLDYRVTDRWRVWSQYQHTSSDSDLPRYDYTGNVYLLGLETMF
jgi:tetratricopeptide (TPR) repeat protein